MWEECASRSIAARPDEMQSTKTCSTQLEKRALGGAGRAAAALQAGGLRRPPECVRRRRGAAPTCHWPGLAARTRRCERRTRTALCNVPDTPSRCLDCPRQQQRQAPGRRLVCQTPQPLLCCLHARRPPLLPALSLPLLAAPLQHRFCCRCHPRTRPASSRQARAPHCLRQRQRHFRRRATACRCAACPLGSTRCPARPCCAWPGCRWLAALCPPAQSAGSRRQGAGSAAAPAAATVSAPRSRRLVLPAGCAEGWGQGKSSRRPGKGRDG